MNITKEALLERGFVICDSVYSFPEDGKREVWVRFGSEPNVLISTQYRVGEYNHILIPHAKTLEDIDHLIRLFIG